MATTVSKKAAPVKKGLCIFDEPFNLNTFYHQDFPTTPNGEWCRILMLQQLKRSIDRPFYISF